MQGDSTSRPIRVLLFSSLFPHEGEPTLGVFVQNRLRHLLKDQHVEATVVAPVPWFPLPWKIFGRYGRAAKAKPVSFVDGVTVYHPRYIVVPRIGMMLAPYTMAWSASRLIRRLIGKGAVFDLLDAHYLYPDGVAAMHIARKLNLPFVVTARGSDVTQIALMPGPKRRVLHACKAASHVITVSQSLKGKLNALGVNEAHITSVRNGIDHDRFSPVDGARATICQKTNLDPKRSIVLFAGWLIQRKRVDILLDALVFIPEMQAVIVGDGDLRSKLTIRAQDLGIEKRVVFVGQQSPADMPTFFSAVDVFCLPSEREGWANVMLEAMACGTPLVARGVDGALELVKTDDVGQLVDGNDPEKYADAIIRVLEANLDRHYIREYAKGYGWATTSATQARIFKEAILSKGVEIER